MDLQEVLGLVLGHAAAPGSGIEEGDLLGGDGLAGVLIGKVDACVLRVALNVLGEAIAHAAKRQRGGDQRPLLCHLQGGVGAVIGGLAAGAALAGIAAAVAGCDDVFRAVYDLHQVTADAEVEKTVLHVLDLALHGVALAQAVGHSHLLRAGLEQRGVLRHGVAVLLADHAEVHSALQRGGGTSVHGDGIVLGVGDAGYSQCRLFIGIGDQLIHLVFFLSTALLMKMQAFSSSSSCRTSRR